jgi:hypothetical protein
MFGLAVLAAAFCIVTTERLVRHIRRTRRPVGLLGQAAQAATWKRALAVAASFTWLAVMMIWYMVR